LFGYDEFFSTGLLTPLVLVVAASILLFSRDKKELYHRRLLQFAFIGSIFFLFLQSRASSVLWETVPYLPYFQFPWRMMGPLALLTSITAGLSFAHFCKGQPGKTIVMRELILLCFCVLNAVPHLRAVRPLPPQISSQLGRLLSLENIKNFGLSATYYDEFLPRFVEPNGWRLHRSKMGPVVGAIPSADVKVVEDTGTKIILETEAGTPFRLQLARWNFPGWTCRINGKAHQLESNRVGSIDVSVPAGFNRIVLELHPPLLRRITVWVSLASLIAWFSMMVS
jgi:hypothetical protein